MTIFGVFRILWFSLIELMIVIAIISVLVQAQCRCREPVFQFRSFRDLVLLWLAGCKAPAFELSTTKYQQMINRPSGAADLLKITFSGMQTAWKRPMLILPVLPKRQTVKIGG